MPSMLETLIGGAVRRQDKKLMVGYAKPAPRRSRDLFNILMGLGEHATLQTLARGTDLRDADPRHVVFAALDRWPDAQELSACASDYNARQHLRSLVTSQEFYGHIGRRICDAYPERPRQCFVRLPRCAGEHFLKSVGRSHPALPPSLAGASNTPRPELVTILGRFLGAFSNSRTILLDNQTLSAFRGTDGRPPIQRPGDRLFTILRDPAALVLSQVDSLASRLARPSAEDDAETAGWRRRLPPGSAADPVRAILAAWPVRNPICTALGDGTAEGTAEACRVADLEMTDLDHYALWLRYTWGVEADTIPSAPSGRLSPQDLTTGGRIALEAIVAEDTLFYSRVRPLIAASATGAGRAAAL